MKLIIDIPDYEIENFKKAFYMGMGNSAMQYILNGTICTEEDIKGLHDNNEIISKKMR